MIGVEARYFEKRRTDLIVFVGGSAQKNSGGVRWRVLNKWRTVGDDVHVPTMRAGGNWSRSARVKAFNNTRFAVASARNLATLPSKMVVLARMAGSSS